MNARSGPGSGAGRNGVLDAENVGDAERHVERAEGLVQPVAAAGADEHHDMVPRASTQASGTCLTVAALSRAISRSDSTGATFCCRYSPVEPERPRPPASGAVPTRAAPVRRGGTPAHDGVRVREVVGVRLTGATNRARVESGRDSDQVETIELERVERACKISRLAGPVRRR